MAIHVKNLRDFGAARDDDNICARAADEIELLRAAIHLVLGDWDRKQPGTETPRHCVSRSTIDACRAAVSG